MKKLILAVKLILALFFYNGCAVSYHPIHPQRLNYGAFDSKDGIEFSYKYDILRERGNARYAKHADGDGVKVVAVKLTNHTDSTIVVRRDLIFYDGLRPISLMEPNSIKHAAGQSVPTYLFYLLLTPMKLYTSNGSTTESFPIGYIVGPGITIGNIAVASSSNNKMLNELLYYDLYNKEIKKGETVYGIIGFRDHEYNPLSVRLNKR